VIAKENGLDKEQESLDGEAKFPVKPTRRLSKKSSTGQKKG